MNYLTGLPEQTAFMRDCIEKAVAAFIKTNLRVFQSQQLKDHGEQPSSFLADVQLMPGLLCVRSEYRSRPPSGGARVMSELSAQRCAE